MPEVAVTKKATETPAVKRSGEVFQPMFPFGRFFGLSPFAMMREFTYEMDRMFRGNGSETGIQMWAPTTDVQRCDGNLVISAELPGLKKEDVKVEVRAKTDQVKAELKDGVLKVSIPVPELAKKSRQVPVAG